jgi:prophage maintenance system killer protein
MEICKEDIIRIGKGFNGILRNDASIDFALEKQTDHKLGEYKKLAYLIRAIVIDHPFSDGNKKTAAYVCFMFAEQTNKQADSDLIKHQLISIASKNINKIRAIEERLKNAIK